MAVTVKPSSVQFTAVNAGVAFVPMRNVVGMTLQGASLTQGQRLTVRAGATPGAGSVIADYVIEDPGASGIENADLWGSKPRQLVSGVSVDNQTLGGTWVLTVFLGDYAE